MRNAIRVNISVLVTSYHSPIFEIFLKVGVMNNHTKERGDIYTFRIPHLRGWIYRK